MLVAFRGARGDEATKNEDTFAAASAPRGTDPRGPALRFRCRVSVVDVDLKPIANVPKWLATHREIAENWASRGADARDDAARRA